MEQTDCGFARKWSLTLLLIAATPTSADTVAAAGAFLAGVDVLRRFRVELIGIELHLAPRKLAFFPGMR